MNANTTAVRVRESTESTAPPVGVDFESSEELRGLLWALHERGAGAWRHDAVAAELMRHTARRYGPLARRHGLDPWEAASAAFVAMRATATRTALDPWAVITRAVQLACAAESRGNGLLCSPDRARRTPFDGVHDPQRFSDTDTPLDEYHPALRIPAPDPFTTPDGDLGATSDRLVEDAIRRAVTVFCLLGWPRALTDAGVTLIATRVGDRGSTGAAFASLSRDFRARVQLGIPARSWHTLLHVTLGSPNDSDTAPAVAGVLTRLLIGEPIRALLTDEELVRRIHAGNPHTQTTGGTDG